MLPLIDPTILTTVVRQDQRNPAFDIPTWTVEPLPAGRGGSEGRLAARRAGRR